MSAWRPRGATSAALAPRGLLGITGDRRSRLRLVPSSGTAEIARLLEQHRDALRAAYTSAVENFAPDPVGLVFVTALPHERASIADTFGEGQTSCGLVTALPRWAVREFVLGLRPVATSVLASLTEPAPPGHAWVVVSGVNTIGAMLLEESTLRLPAQRGRS